MFEEGFIYLHHGPRPSKNDLGVSQKPCGAYFPQPLVDINCRVLIYFSLLCNVRDWVLPRPHIHDQKPFLEGQARLREETSFTNGLPSFTLGAPPTDSITNIPSRSLLHEYSTSGTLIYVVVITGIPFAFHIAYLAQVFVRASKLCARRYVMIPSVPPKMTGPSCSKVISKFA